MKRQRGFSLIEILVTMVLTSIGLLGIAGLIVTSLKNNKSSYSRTQATFLATDIVDRMRANRGMAEADSLPYNLALEDTPTGTGVVADDLRTWRTIVSESVPEGKGAVKFDPTSKNVVVTIQWNDSLSSGDKVKFGLEKQTLAVETRL